MRLEFEEGKSSKFWEVQQEGSELHIRWGRIGTQGQGKTVSFADASRAEAEARKLAESKLKKGYREAAATPARPAVARIASPAATAVLERPEEPPAVTGAPSVAWTESARARVHPRPGAPLEPCPAEAVWKGFRHRFTAAQLNPLLGTATPTVRRLLRQARARFDSGAVPQDPEVEAVLAVGMGLYNRDNATAWRLPEYWAQLVDPAFMLEVMGASLQFSREESFLDGATYLCRKAAADRLAQLGPWTHVRRALCRATQAQRHTARERAAELRGSAPLPLRCALSFAFPEEKAWAQADLEECLQNPISRWGSQKVLPDGGWWLLACLDAPGVERLLREHGSEYWDVDLAFSVVDGLGSAAGPLLARPLEARDRPSDHRKTLAEAVCLVETPEVAALVRPYLEEPGLRPLITAYYRRCPRLAIPALARVRSESGRALMQGLVRSHPETAQECLPSVPERDRAGLESLLGRSAVRHPEAPRDRLPPVLADPPWTRERAARRPKVVEVAPLELPEEIHWPRGSKPRPYYYRRPPLRDDPGRDTRALKELRAAVPKGLSADDLDRLSDRLALEFWNSLPEGTVLRYPWEGWEPLLSRFGTEGLGGFLKVKDTARVVATLQHVRSARLAPVMAEALERLKGSRPVARTWLLRFSEEAAAGLIPPAVGPPGKRRDQAEAALRYLAAQGRTDGVRSLADRYGPQVRDAVEEILAFDPLGLFPSKLPRLPEFWSPSALTRPLLRDGTGALSLAALDHLGTMLAFSSPDSPYAGLDQVRAACLPEALEEFACDLFSAWLSAGAPAREAWAFLALGHLGGDESARRLAPLLRIWPGESAHARAVQGLDVLAMIGTDVALMHLHGIAQKVKYKALQTKAQEKIEEVAAARNLSAEELADRLVPDLDLEPDGTRWLDFGSRRFQVDFDERLVPGLRDEGGQPLKSLPKPLKADDPERAAEADRVWKALKKDAKAVAETQLLRLEKAMGCRRRWSAAVFRDFLLGHPLMGHLARRLLWGLYDGDRLVQAFRVAEDRTLADCHEDTLELPEGAVVGLPHKLELSDDQVGAWVQLFSDYEILQPFPQLGRATYAPTDAELSGTELERLPSEKLPVGRLFKLEARGWRRGEVVDSGGVVHFEKPLPGGLEAVLEFDPGFHVAAPQESEPQTIASAFVRDPDGRRLPLKEFDAIAYSELVTDLASLGG